MLKCLRVRGFCFKITIDSLSFPKNHEALSIFLNKIWKHQTSIKSKYKNIYILAKLYMN